MLNGETKKIKKKTKKTQVNYVNPQNLRHAS